MSDDGGSAAGAADARHNLRLYPWYVGGVTFYAWLPIFFLYLSSRVSLAEVLALEAIYYASVVLLELPSGYVSDRFGRRAAMRLAAGALFGAYVLFALSDGFVGFAVAQATLAVGLAFNSGTDTSFHLANLQLAGQGERYADREARLTGLALGLGAGAALVGGALALLDLRLAYVASAAGALVAVVITWRLRPAPEPAMDGERATRPFGETLAACVRAARTPHLAWCFLVAVVAVVLNHLPYEFYQPYLARLDAAPWPAELTPLVAGLHLATTQAIAAPAARWSCALVERWGLAPYLLATLGLQVALIGGMALVFSPIIAVLVIARAVPGALQSAPLRAAIAPHIEPRMRATYLSLQSLAGRLAFAAVLGALALFAGETLVDAMRLSAGVALGLTLYVASRARRRGALSRPRAG